MFDLKGVTVMVIDAQPKRTVAAEVKRKVDAGQCLQCEEKAARGRRGLCQSHYTEFRDAIDELSDDELKAKAEATLIRDGEVLKSGELRKKKNRFRELLRS